MRNLAEQLIEAISGKQAEFSSRNDAKKSLGDVKRIVKKSRGGGGGKGGSFKVETYTTNGRYGIDVTLDNVWTGPKDAMKIMLDLKNALEANGFVCSKVKAGKMYKSTKSGEEPVRSPVSSGWMGQSWLSVTGKAE